MGRLILEDASNGLWAMTTYFNPVGYKRRLENYRLFRRRLKVPLVTVELAFDEAFALGPVDADILIQIRGGDVMWQKERLLNLALPHVPSHINKVAWVDCDVIFDSDDWPAKASLALDDHVFVQLFQERLDLPPTASADEQLVWAGESPYHASMYAITTGEASAEDLARRDILTQHGSSPGLAWAGRREVLDSRGFYDACIAGGADRAFICAALGAFDAGQRAQQMNRRRAEHYLSWARPFFEIVRGSIACIPGRVFHLWHGHLADRQYDSRLAVLAQFDPFTDITVNSQGAWNWTASGGALREPLTRYFEQRNEDGSGAS